MLDTLIIGFIGGVVTGLIYGALISLGLLDQEFKKGNGVFETKRYRYSRERKDVK